MNNLGSPLNATGGGTGDAGGAWTAYTPTITNSYTTASATGRYKRIGKTMFVEMVLTITTIGSATGNPQLSLPTQAAAFPYFLIGRDNGSSGKALVGSIGASSTTIYIVNFDNTSPAIAGAILAVSGVYETV